MGYAHLLASVCVCVYKHEQSINNTQALKSFGGQRGVHVNPLPPPLYEHVPLFMLLSCTRTCARRTRTHTHTHTHAHTHTHTQVTVAGLLSLAYSPETHQHLTKPHIIEGVMETCNIQRTMYSISAEERKLECLLLKYVSKWNKTNCSQLVKNRRQSRSYR